MTTRQELAIIARRMSAPSRHPHWLLRRANQVAVAALVVVALAAMGGWWIAQGGWGGRLIEIDRAEPLTARFQVDINRADWPELCNCPASARRWPSGSSSRGRRPARSPTRTTCGGCAASGQRRWNRFAPICGRCRIARTSPDDSSRNCEAASGERTSAMSFFGRTEDALLRYSEACARRRHRGTRRSVL